MTALALALSGCEFATDTPLGVTSDQRAVAPAGPVEGRIINPDGKMTVTIAPSALPTENGHRSLDERPCDYRSSSRRFSCPTEASWQGLYVVQVTDAAQPGEGTALAQVALTDVPGYDPQIKIGDGTGEAEPGPVLLRLSGWQPGRAVTVRLLDEDLRPLLDKQVRPDAQGDAELRTPALSRGFHDLEATDGLWKIGGEEGVANRTQIGILID